MFTKGRKISKNSSQKVRKTLKNNNSNNIIPCKV